MRTQASNIRLMVSLVASAQRAAASSNCSSNTARIRMFGSTVIASKSNPATRQHDNHSVATKSKRKQFQETQVHPSIRRYIEQIGVGIPNRRQTSKRLRKDLYGQDLEEGRRSGRSGSGTTPPPPFSTGSSTTDSLEKRRIVVIGSVSKSNDTFPTNQERIPEIALAGRSNVGKSTLLNALLYGNVTRKNKEGEENDNQQSLIKSYRRGRTPENVKLPKGIKAVTSPKPGETRKITFYQLSSSISNRDFKLRLVDLPGYGFSFTPKNHEGFQDLLNRYLLERRNILKRVLLLVDARHGLKKADLDFLETLQDHAMKYPSVRKIPPIQIVLTKCDLVKRDDLARRVVITRQQLSDAFRRETSALPVLLVSARPGVGYNNVRKGHFMRARGGVLELQKELAALVPRHTNNLDDETS